MVKNQSLGASKINAALLVSGRHCPPDDSSLLRTSLKLPDDSRLKAEPIKDAIPNLKMEGMSMANDRKQQLEEARQREIVKHLAIFNNDRIAPPLKACSKRRLIELNILDERGVFKYND